jgi:LmbE family N-acetylglucosaminyl deacetylase
VRDACFYAGLRGRQGGEPHRPAAVFSYMQHDPFAVAFVVDVSAVWEVKQRALDAYASQLHRPAGGGAAAGGAPTKVATPEFRLAIAGRAQHFGLMVGAAYGEPFWSPLPLAVADPLSLLPGGPR